MAFGLGACGELTNAEPSGQQARSLGSVVAGLDAPEEYSGEQLFVELAKAAPSSAGFAYEGRRLVVYVASESERPTAEEFVRGAVAGNRILPPGAGQTLEAISSRTVKYSYAQLADYRNKVDALLFGKDENLQFIDLDERANAVTLGYSGDSGSVVALLKRELSLSQSDDQVIQVAHASRAVVDSRPTASSVASFFAPWSLVADADMIVGGLLTTRPNGAVDPTGCTIGFAAKRNGITGFVTNSHCTQEMYGLGGTYSAFGQVDRLIGTETIDPDGYFCAIAPPTWW